MSVDKMSMLGLSGGLQMDSREETIVTFIKHITNNLCIEDYFMSMEFTLLIVDFVQNGVSARRIKAAGTATIVANVTAKVFDRKLSTFQKKKIAADVKYLTDNDMTTYVTDGTIYAKKMTTFFFR